MADELFDHYRHTREKSGVEKGTIGLNFAKALNKFQDPATLRREHLDEFVKLYNPANRHGRKATWRAEVDAAGGTGPDGRWRAYDYADLMARDKASLDIFWLKDDALADSDNLPPPDVIAQEIVDDLEAALEQFRLIAGDLEMGKTGQSE